ncbi:MAG TPA: hypothetical protein VKZ50_11155 [bacterium]|nr:hypothetical protein [bacterium]
MSTPKDLKRYRQIIEEATVGLGRDDVGVGDVTETRDGVLAVTFSRGAHSTVEEIPVDALRDRGQANQALVKAIRGLSKEVAQEALHKV